MSTRKRELAFGFLLQMHDNDNETNRLVFQDWLKEEELWDEDNLRSYIVQFPHLDGLRANYANLQTELGNENRADFILRQLEIANFLRQDVYIREGGIAAYKRYEQNKQKCEELQQKYGTTWVRPLALALGLKVNLESYVQEDFGFKTAGRTPLDVYDVVGRRVRSREYARWNFERGFMNILKIPTEWWLTHGKNIVLVEPITQLILEPGLTPVGDLTPSRKILPWDFGDPSGGNNQVWSQKALVWAREAVGLPKLMSRKS